MYSFLPYKHLDVFCLSASVASVPSLESSVLSSQSQDSDDTIIWESPPTKRRRDHLEGKLVCIHLIVLCSISAAEHWQISQPYTSFENIPPPKHVVVFN